MNEIKKKIQEGKGLVISDCVLGNFSLCFFFFFGSFSCRSQFKNPQG